MDPMKFWLKLQKVLNEHMKSLELVDGDASVILEKIDKLF